MSERLAFVVVFSLMAAFVVGLTMLAAKSGASPLIGRTTPSVSKPLPPLPDEVVGSNLAPFSARLATSLRAAVGSHVRQLSVGVIDMTSGATAMYRPGTRYDAANIVRADMLAALLYQNQRARTSLSSTDASLATEMIQDGSAAAAARLWQAIGGSQGFAVANEALMLRHTTAGQGGAGLIRTTVADQLQLLMDLTAGNSALHSAARSEALDLLAGGAASEPRGVAAAASQSTSRAVINGTQPDPRLWLADSIGVIKRDGHELLIAVLSRGSPTEAAGTTILRAAAMVAAQVIMTPVS